MTEDELKKEAEKHCNEVMCTVCENKTCTEKIKCREWRDRRAGYYCGAEPREKRIAELEKQLDIVRDERNLFQERCEDILENYYCDHPCKCAELEKSNTSLLTSVENLNKSVQELEAQIEKMKCCGNCIHLYEGTYHNGYRCKDHARESVCDNWEIMTDEIRKELLENDL